ncbi:four helix bundle protein [Pedobacter aquatilis]|uniref:four helix bundle protein n=1 Tax=Pedobacter aquatilis TaxID=351343 RepID=UPI0025B2827F|nr:four helix bundle protein [Pedobacter aquatilis]MDN3585543.1 four helix bundle protein [Pedobacter aquatilis]
MQDYKVLLVWRKAHHFTLKMYMLVATFPKDETYNLISQVKRSSSSIPTNIAEGCGRFTQKDLANFLQVALGSSHELEYQLLLSKDLGFIQAEQYLELEKEVGEIKAMLISLIKKVRI